MDPYEALFSGPAKDLLIKLCIAAEVGGTATDHVFQATRVGHTGWRVEVKNVDEAPDIVMSALDELEGGNYVQGRDSDLADADKVWRFALTDALGDGWCKEYLEDHPQA